MIRMKEKENRIPMPEEDGALTDKELEGVSGGMATRQKTIDGEDGIRKPAEQSGNLPGAFKFGQRA